MTSDSASVLDHWVELAGDRLLILPWRVRVTQELYAASLLDGRLPWRRDEVSPGFGRPPPLPQRPSRELELAAAAVARELALPHRANLDPHEARPFDLMIPGEIDLLVADISRSRIWVCEVKTRRRASRSMLGSEDESLRGSRRIRRQAARQQRAVAGKPGRCAWGPRYRRA